MRKVLRWRLIAEKDYCLWGELNCHKMASTLYERGQIKLSGVTEKSRDTFLYNCQDCLPALFARFGTARERSILSTPTTLVEHVVRVCVVCIAQSAIDVRRIVLPLCDVAVFMILSAGRQTWDVQRTVSSKYGPWDVKAAWTSRGECRRTESVFMWVIRWSVYFVLLCDCIHW